ncbi:MAG: glycosyltransferase [Anaerolineae bacterium]|jgi:glycosyltransferase involved in cell wall biosynthesis
MSEALANSLDEYTAFRASPRQHILMITNHGIHQWKIIPGLPDTGGQNVFVNQFTEALAELGFRITIVNRGGYPHPVTGEPRRGLHYRDENQRILYLEDGLQEFVRKEDMDERIPHLVEFLRTFLDAEGTTGDLILSHYWDGLKIGALLNGTLSEPARHIWTPHSLGAIKKRNVSPDQWADLRVDERIAAERKLLKELDGVAATSSLVRRSLEEDYEYTGTILFLPPSVDTDRFHPREVSDGDEVWEFLSRWSGLSPAEVQGCRIVTEISRTAATKRKSVLIEAFAMVERRIPNSLLVVSVDDNKKELAGQLRGLIRALGIQNCVATYVPDDVLPALYAVADVYCTPSVMEGFGMSVQEATATGIAVVASDLVPFATEYLLGADTTEVDVEGVDQPLKLGEGAIVVPADDVKGFACALEMLLSDNDLREAMGWRAYQITIPYFTWPRRVSRFLKELNVKPERPDD